VEFDRAKGWRTGAVRLGTGFVRAEIAALVAFAYVLPVALWLGLGFGPGVLLPLLSAPLGWWTVNGVRTRTQRELLHPLTPAMARLAVVHSVLLAVGLAVAG
jgi:1,4-dihydroxy-2-naphthoate octaprenyltransferase